MNLSFVLKWFLLVLFCFNCVSYSVFSQQKKKEFSFTLPQYTFKINPTCLINIFRPSLFVSSDFQLHKRLYADVGVGWIFTHLGLSKNESYNGLRSRLGLRYLFGKSSKVVGFVGFEAKANYIVHNQYQTVCRAGCQYEQIMLIRRTVEHFGIAPRVGFWVPMGNEKISFFEFYAGVGYRYVNVKSALPEDGDNLQNRGRRSIPSFQSDGVFHYPDLLTGVYFGINFYKKAKTPKSE